jgi:sulfoxide reductase catalytic subunit YedY
MHVRIPPGWELPEREATPERVFRERRRFVAALGLGTIAGALPLRAQERGAPPGTAPARRDPRFTLDRPLTEEDVAARHNIFDEFAAERDRVWQAAAGFRTEPWRVHIGGQVKAAKTLDVAELVRLAGGAEERLYRHRCVETWAMAVPWTGIPLKRLVELAEPLGKARYLRVVSAARPAEMPGWYATRRVFPYYEALRLDEATSELAFLATGIYGHPLPPQHGAPLRLVLPWKYGFKSAKALVAFAFTAERPGTFWSDLSPDKYDFLANVDPAVPKPWPQTHETMLGTEERRETRPYNGYGDFVAALYA